MYRGQCISFALLSLSLPLSLSFSFFFLHAMPYFFPPFPSFSFRYKGVLQLDPRDTRAMGSLALAYVDKGDTEEATRWLRQTVEMDPTSRAPVYNLAVIMTRSNRHAEAVPLLNQLLSVGACLFLYVQFTHYICAQICSVSV